MTAPRLELPIPKRYIRSARIGVGRFWFLFDEGAVEGIVSSDWDILRHVATRHAHTPLPLTYGWMLLPAEVRS